MDLERLGIAIGFAHTVIYLAMLAIFTTATLDEHDFGPIAVYITMAVLSVTESVAGCYCIAAIIEENSLYMLPMLIVTPITAVVGMFDAVAVFPYGRMAMTITISILSVVSLVPVYTLYSKYKGDSTLPQVSGTTENCPLNVPEIVATAPPPALPYPYVPAKNNATSETLDGEPPSYGAAMTSTAALPYPAKSSHVGYTAIPCNPVPGSSAATSFGWRSDLGQDVANK